MHTSLDSAAGRQSLLSNIGEKLLVKNGGAAAAYSLRALNGNGGPVVRLRREADNDERDFTAAQLTSGEMLTWATALSGPFARTFVVTWYDQSGNGNDASQSTLAYQPLIVDNGTYLGEIDFSGDYLITTEDLSLTQEFTSISVAKSDAAATTGGIFSIGASASSTFQTILGFFRSDGGLAINSGSTLTTQSGTPAFTFSANTDYLQFNVFDGSSSEIFANGSSRVSGDAGSTNPNSKLIIGLFRSASTAYLNGNISEIIIYDSDQSANRTAIEDNINDYYDIY